MFEQYLDIFIGVVGNHPYIFIFIGLLFAGETILLPAIYFALDGKLHMPHVILTAIIATLVSDYVWYYVGLHMGERFARRMVKGKVQKRLEKLSGPFAKHREMVLFFSKFVYGARTAAQILAGLQKMPFRRYLTINILGVTVLTLFIAVLAYSIEETVENLTTIIHNVEIAFLIFVVVLVLAQLTLGAYFKKLWSR
jgi:membrane protein DedA with SNARE-associated domain